MQLILVRHALPVRHLVTEGAADPELSTDGRAQAEHLARWLADERIAAIYTSPMRRAVETSEPVARTLGIAPIVDARLSEWDRNASEYVPVEELKRTNDPRWQALVRGDWEGDETPAEFSARVRAAIEEIIGAHASSTVAVVCHGGVINDFLAGVLGLSTNRFFYPNYTSISRVMASRSGHRAVVSVNETAHLRGSGLPTGVFDER